MSLSFGAREGSWKKVMDDGLLTVLHGSKDLGADVVRGADGHVALHSAVLRQAKAGAKVCKPDVSVGVKQDVVRLDVPVDVAEVVD